MTHGLPGAGLPTAKHADLIYDVGLHRGEDTDFYLRKGFRVVAFEANPENAEFCRLRFVEALQSGQLTLIAGAIVDRPAGSFPERVAFYRNLERSTWGTVRRDWAESKALRGAPSTSIEVEAVDFGAVLERYGIPHYLKLDVEGCEETCLAALRRFRERPDYISLESEHSSFLHIRREIDLLKELGYDGFQIVDQLELAERQAPPFPPREGGFVPQRFETGSTGLFGAELPGTWRSRRHSLRRYRTLRAGWVLAGDGGVIRRSSVRGIWRLESLVRRAIRWLAGIALSGWYDTHARHGSVVRE